MEVKNRDLKLKTEYETKSCRIYAQRMHIQQHCIENQDQILEDIQTTYVDKINFTDKLNTALDEPEKVFKIFDEWLEGYKHLEPSNFFNEYPTNDPFLVCNIQKPRDFLMDTLEYFGLPKGYMKGGGHWTTWKKKVLEKRKMERKRRKPTAQRQRRGNKRRRAKEKEEEQPPEYFDLEPFQLAFKKFILAGVEVRTQFRQAISNSPQDLNELFSNENGELINSRCQNIISIAKDLEKLKLEVPTETKKISGEMLECFGNVLYDKVEVTEVIKKEEVKGDDMGGKFGKK